MILLIGKRGQVGWALRHALLPLGEVTTLGREDLDLADNNAIRAIVRDLKPAIIVNAAAYTAVDKAESEPDIAKQINATAPTVLARESAAINALLVHYSTDYVFDGTKAGAYTEEDLPNPINVYGETKLQGEKGIQETGCSHLIFRTSWVYGSRGRNFFLTMLRLAKERDELSIISDQIGAPTSSRFLAEATAVILGKWLQSGSTSHPAGIYHMTSSGSTSWFGFAEAIFRSVDNIPVPQITPVSSSEYVTAASRPSNSVLSCTKLSDTFAVNVPSWETILQHVCLEVEANKGS